MKNEHAEKTDPTPNVFDWDPAHHMDLKALSTDINRPISLFEQRRMVRISERELEGFSVSLQVPGEEQWTKVHLWDFSSLGFGLYCPGMQGGRLKVQADEEVRVRIGLPRQGDFEVACSVKNQSRFRDGVKLGLRRLDLGSRRKAETERRDGKRLALAHPVALHARLKHPLLYDHWSSLSAWDVNRNMGFAFHCNDASLLVCEGMEVDIYFDLPAHRHLPLRVKVTWVRALGNFQVRFGVHCIGASQALHAGLCDHLLHSQRWSPQRLRELGFLVRRVKEHIKYRSVRSAQDYAKVLELRWKAYVAAGRLSPNSEPESTAGALDESSWILCCFHRELLVGSLTLTFPDTDGFKLECEQAFGGKYPFPIPPKTTVVEASRLCTHIEYRTGDLLRGIFEHAVKYFLLSEREWILTSAVKELLPLYREIGFREVGATFAHPNLGGMEHHMILCHRNSFIRGTRMKLSTWLAVFGDLMHFMLRRRQLDVPWYDRFLVRFMLLFKPLIIARSTVAAERAFRRHIAIIKRRNIG